ncbi:hypothetical protein A3E96_00845 [Candidatus Uhrbacteria bacterium RIFCSPHIGHO2_12_FULL_46_13]|uniref:CR-type domain-containing protein n=1 Tax=Candidatus Uhrbacteria bacterium RIFCSPLOWO2_01_FULL_47_25 TaxID=1802402 RepID=A0A1F7US65_9BACT|nr:MAG: hypothetical protein UX68_C0042G0004 [Parcubacteria group bacterium GW2011_GWA2_46_9]OGL59256.1 MAG: hypothetical protein A2752_01125 [Candidatus Uhrbacteria bacterium RIFCSPHIGHO2_01_FULL_46_23]OGL68499.1 MAG: hypothetical protein A3D60_02690 [Candidatus Uhrbacteria bacterium RIFCSPHIGHO2_02_FULL_47_29]OGL75575.1 MAG: hypothetical protein A3E96_00845 [Candidatus Uhrbacteria bacterium RIFCSPHIGHO2_12_FULL_46_13]OGL81089.1 MAG: hypothetical protein A2936_00610 [Candidatus Uhrbacteria bac
MIANGLEKATALAQQFFSLGLPCSLQDLKTAFRKKAKQLHTDTSGGDTKAAFVTMKEAYDFLVSLKETMSGVFAENGSGTKKFATTVEGLPLTELGLGLGPTTNGRDCPDCGRAGYTKDFGNAFTVCEKCDKRGTIPRAYACRYCEGTGRFVQARSRREVSCRACGGSGRFKDPRQRQLCPHCLGTKTIWGKPDTVFYRKCWKCHGTGEIQVFNPVIIKGSLG